jgi:hypothetical protein
MAEEAEQSGTSEARPGPVLTVFGATTAILAWLLVAPAWWRPLQDPDLWWLLGAGTALLRGQLPATNAVSFTAPDTPWVLHEPAVAMAYAAVGLAGIPLLRGLVLSVTGLLLVHVAARPRHGWATVLGVAWALPLLAGAVSERALAWGDLFLAATVALLRSKRRWAPAVAALVVGACAEVHGSFVLGVGLLALEAPAWAVVAAALSLLNPNGFQLWALIAGYASGTGAPGFATRLVAEWDWLAPTSPAAILALGAVASGGVLALAGEGRRRDKVLYVVLAAGALRHARGCAPLAIVLLPAVVDRLVALTPSDRPLGRPLPLLAGALLLTALVVPTPRLDGGRYPEAVRAAIPAGARTWSDLPLGAWLAAGGVPVFWDARNDCYPEAVLADGATIQWQLDGWEEVLGAWRVEAVVTTRASLADDLERAGWRPGPRVGEVRLLLAR